MRSDPLLKLACGSLPETGRHLASQPTIPRLENAATVRACYEIAEMLFGLYVEQRGKDGAPKKIVLDLNATDDPARGRQLLPRLLQGQCLPHPLLVFDGDTGQMIAAVLRAGNTHASRGAVAILSRIVTRLRRLWPSVQIEFRADAGFAVPALYEYCEAEGIHYAIGLITNARLEELAKPLLERARWRYEDEGRKTRLLTEGLYQAGSWDRNRRVVYKAEVIDQGTNTRFGVTNKRGESGDLYEWYTRREETENRIKDFKRAVKADRLSCHRFVANQFRLLLHAAAYWLLDVLRSKLVKAGVERMQLDTLRLILIKVGGRVR